MNKMKMNISSVLVFYILCYLGESEGKRMWRICAGKWKQRRGPFGDNSIKQKSLWRYRDNNTRMVNMLVDWHYIKWEKVREVFTRVDRKDFVYDMPYQDIPKHLGYCSWASAPHTVAKIIDLAYLNLHRGARVLEIGSGSGYMATIMAHLVGPTGHVTGLEHMLDVCAESIANISINHIELIGNQTIDIIHKDGRHGHEEGGPYDLIVASCAFPEWPKHLEDQVANGGRLLVPVGREGQLQNITIMDKMLLGTKYWFTEDVCSFEPLMKEADQEKRFRDQNHFVTLHLTSTTVTESSNWVRSDNPDVMNCSYYQRWKNSSAFKGEW